MSGLTFPAHGIDLDGDILANWLINIQHHSGHRRGYFVLLYTDATNYPTQARTASGSGAFPALSAYKTALACLNFEDF
ncbi:hypothetical protein [Klebsiella quasipneumoniae]|uniref:hypothetical protein n=1 Tax=Klebsiella quasipneumoniae TaxID=1463165 RepID=UPI00115AED7B|nr:hypothetical protein [Klebsiella quasipneumoniae]